MNSTPVALSVHVAFSFDVLFYESSVLSVFAFISCLLTMRNFRLLLTFMVCTLVFLWDLSASYFIAVINFSYIQYSFHFTLRDVPNVLTFRDMYS